MKKTKMLIKPIRATIVVHGNNHNPTIINRDFLEIQEIVPEGWKEKTIDKDILTTPQLARVPYKNGVVIQVEPNKATFIDNNFRSFEKWDLPSITSKFIHTLKHVRYKAIRFVFFTLIEHKQSEDFLRHSFLQEKEWQIENAQFRGVGLRLVYEFANCILNLAIDPGTVKGKNQSSEKSVILINGNFYRECDKYPADQQIEGFLDKIEQDWTNYLTITKKLLDI
jgi:hypothetical protein